MILFVFMFIEVVDINGQYSPETGEHVSPCHMPDGYYEKLSTTLARAASRGAHILYKPNLTFYADDIFASQSEIKRALASDPFLALGGRDIDTMVVRPNGNRPLDIVVADCALENELLKRAGSAVVLGAYTNECVPATAFNLSARNPGYPVAIDPTLSIDRGAPLVYAGWASLFRVSIIELLLK